MVEAVERQTSVNEGSSYFRGDWLIEFDVPSFSVAAGVTEEQDVEGFANVAFVYLIEVDTACTDYELKVWNDETRAALPALHLEKNAALSNYRRLFLYVDEDREGVLHFDIINNSGVSRDFHVTMKAVRQI